MRPRKASVTIIATLSVLVLLGAAIPAARGVVEYDRKMSIQHPQSPRGPHYYGYFSPLPILPGTAPKKHKCIPNGQARCMDTVHTRAAHNTAFSKGSSQQPDDEANTIEPIIKQLYNYYPAP